VGDRSSIESELNQLRAEIPTLLNLPALSPEFSNWLGKLFTLVKADFGWNSEEIHQLRAISPELPSEFYDSVEKRLGAMGGIAPLDVELGGQALPALSR